ncbi:MAG: MarR family winged helix-turn-helix transcriptional regulator [Planctomycetaceae bacterium]
MSHSLTSPPSQTCPATGGEPAGETGRIGPASTSLARLGTLLQRAVQAHGVAVADCASDRGLSDARFRILDALSGNWGSECTQSELAARLRQSESHLSELLEGLADGGFISRERSPRDRRKTLVRATPAGADVAADMAGLRDHRLRERLAGWSGDEVGQLLTALNRLCADLDPATAPDEPQEGGPAECPTLARSTPPSPPRLTTAGR